METIKVPTGLGYIDVPAHTEEKCHNLCVTMVNFGSFEITHITSGRRLYGGFERASSAVVEMLKLELSFRDIGINSPMSMSEIQSAILDSDLKVSRLGGMRVIEYIKLCCGLEKITNEFPWESFEESPFGIAEELRKQFAE